MQRNCALELRPSVARFPLRRAPLLNVTILFVFLRRWNSKSAERFRDSNTQALSASSILLPIGTNNSRRVYSKSFTERLKCHAIATKGFSPRISPPSTSYPIASFRRRPCRGADEHFGSDSRLSDPPNYVRRHCAPVILPAHLVATKTVQHKLYSVFQPSSTQRQTARINNRTRQHLRHAASALRCTHSAKTTQRKAHLSGRCVYAIDNCPPHHHDDASTDPRTYLSLYRLCN